MTGPTLAERRTATKAITTRWVQADSASTGPDPRHSKRAQGVHGRVAPEACGAQGAAPAKYCPKVVAVLIFCRALGIPAGEPLAPLSPSWWRRRAGMASSTSMTTLRLCCPACRRPRSTVAWHPGGASISRTAATPPIPGKQRRRRERFVEQRGAHRQRPPTDWESATGLLTAELHPA